MDQDLKKAGLKTTGPRVKILAVFNKLGKRHMSAEEIYKHLLDTGEEIGLATVYRVLTQFEAADLVKRHNFEGGHAVFEMNEGEHHDHMVCVKCGAVSEFLDEEIERRQEMIAKQNGFKMVDHSLIIYGLCSVCSVQ